MWQAHAYNGVSRMVWDILAIPAMSAECERIFSSAAQVVATLWNGLKEDINVIEANECLKVWFAQEGEN